MDFFQWIQCIAAGLLWGITTPFLKAGGAVVTRKQKEHDEKRRNSDNAADTSIPKTLRSIMFYVQSPEFLVPFLLNQLGGIIYLIVLGSASMSVVSPICGMLSFISTALIETLVFNTVLSSVEITGAAMVVAGLLVSFI